MTGAPMRGVMTLMGMILPSRGRVLSRLQTNVKLDEKIDDIYMPLNISVVEKFDIPFLDKEYILVDGESFTLGKIFEDVDDYYKMTGSFVDDAIDDVLKIIYNFNPLLF